MRNFFCAIALCFAMLMPWNQLHSFDKVVIWGHKLHSHTHSYIHNAFFRAFVSLGYDTYWFDDKDSVENFDFSNALFITEGQADGGIPLRDDSKYILHNCTSDKYSALPKRNRICLQVYTDDVLNRSGHVKVAPCIYYDLEGRCVYMPWATDLLPGEIENMKLKARSVKKSNKVFWVGTVGGGFFGNEDQIKPFIKACVQNNVKFVKRTHVSVEENVLLIMSSYMAPTIVGAWQQEKGYIPCRIFKNISYGQMGVTNSPRVNELFEGRIVFNTDTYQLFFDAQKKIKETSVRELEDLMDFVKEKHTYINRIETLLDFFDLVSSYYTD